jgi:hypothetical protein
MPQSSKKKKVLKYQSNKPQRTVTIFSKKPGRHLLRLGLECVKPFQYSMGKKKRKSMASDDQSQSSKGSKVKKGIL